MTKQKSKLFLPFALCLFLCVTAESAFAQRNNSLVQTSVGSSSPAQDQVSNTAGAAAVSNGRLVFRFDTFGDEGFWGSQLRLHDAVKGSARGGTGNGITPNQALALGLKIDSDRLAASTLNGLRNGTISMNDPATTVELLRSNAVVGLVGFFNRTGVDVRRSMFFNRSGASRSGFGRANGNALANITGLTSSGTGALTSIGITCALCHSTVDDSVAPGMGRRLDGWPNRDLNAGAIIASAPNLAPLTTLLGTSDDALRGTLNSWGPGKFDAEMILDGKTANPTTGRSSASLIPAAYGLAGHNIHAWVDFGSVPYWNALVANLEMGGLGRFYDERLNDSAKFPIAAANNLWNVQSQPDLITPKMADLHVYQLSLPAPAPPTGSFDSAAAARGRDLFNGKARCAVCHVPPLFTEPGDNTHTGAEVGIEEFQAQRSPGGRYKTMGLKGIWARQRGGFFHDGRFQTLMDVVNHYDTAFSLALADSEKTDLIQYMLSLSDNVPTIFGNRTTFPNKGAFRPGFASRSGVTTGPIPVGPTPSPRPGFGQQTGVTPGFTGTTSVFPGRTTAAGGFAGTTTVFPGRTTAGGGFAGMTTAFTGRTTAAGGFTGATVTAASTGTGVTSNADGTTNVTTTTGSTLQERRNARAAARAEARAAAQERRNALRAAALEKRNARLAAAQARRNARAGFTGATGITPVAGRRAPRRQRVTGEQLYAQNCQQCSSLTRGEIRSISRAMRRSRGGVQPVLPVRTGVTPTPGFPITTGITPTPGTGP